MGGTRALVTIRAASGHYVYINDQGRADKFLAGLLERCLAAAR